MTLPGLFVVGTDTGVGKTYVAAAIARAWRSGGRNVGVLKPVASGATLRDGRLVSDDAQELWEAIGGGVPLDRVNPIVFAEPLAPPVAARRLGQPLTMEAVRQGVEEALDWWASRAEVMVVEGVGGLLCPLTDRETVADLAILLDYPLLVVARRGLGTLNHTLLTVEAARHRGLRVAGVLLNGSSPTVDPVAESTNFAELSERLGGVALLGEWGHDAGPGQGRVAPEAGDWYDRAEPARGRTPPGSPRLGPFDGLMQE